MFGMSLPEIIVIAVIAVLFLGPDKLPSAMVEIAKFFKTVKKNGQWRKKQLRSRDKNPRTQRGREKIQREHRKNHRNGAKKLTFEELDELKKGVNDVTSGITDGLNDVKKSVEAVKNPGEAVKNAVLGDNEKKEA